MTDRTLLRIVSPAAERGALERIHRARARGGASGSCFEPRVPGMGVALLLGVVSLVSGCGDPSPPAQVTTPVPVVGTRAPDVSRAPAAVEPSVPEGAPTGEVGGATRPPSDPDATAPAKPTVEVPPTPSAPVVPETPKPAPRAPVPAAVRAALDAALARVAAGEMSEAVADLRAAEEKLGPSADLRLAQGRAFIALAAVQLDRGEDKFLIKGLVGDAHMRWKQAMEIDPRVPGAAALRARILRFEEDPDTATEVLLAAVKEDPSDREAHLVLAEMATASRNWQHADDHWTRAAVLDPSDGKARLQATIAKQWLGVPADLLEAGYLDAARLLPDDPEPARLLAGLYPRNRDRRVDLLRRAAASNERAAWPRIWLAHILRTEEPTDPKGAETALAEAIRGSPKCAAAHYNLGLLQEQSGRPLDAVRSFLACVENSAEGDCGLASDALDKLMNDPASPVAKDVPLSLRVRCYDAMCAKNPDEGRYGNNAGFWYRDVGRDYEKSVRYYLKSCEASPDEQDFLNDTGLIYLFHLTDRREDCRKFFDRVIELVEDEGQEPVRGYWDTLENLCKYWFEKGEYEKVVEIAKKRADPKATLNGRPYPSMAAAQWGARAAKKLAEGGKKPGR